MRGNRIRLAIALMLAGALASAAMAQVAFAQETGGEFFRNEFLSSVNFRF